MEEKISVELTYNTNQKLSFETSQYESYDVFLLEARLECYKKIVEENAKQETDNNLIPFGYLINNDLFNRNNFPQNSWKFKFDLNQGAEIAKHLAIFNWYIIKSFKHTNEENNYENFVSVKNELDKLLTPIYSKKGLHILTKPQINWLCTQNKFYEALKNVNNLGNTANSPCGTEKIYALSALTHELNNLDPKIQYKSPSKIEKKLSFTDNLIQNQGENLLLSPNRVIVPHKRKIWPKVLLITLGVTLTLGAIALGLLTCGIGTSLLAGIGGAIGKSAIGYITSHILICGGIACGAGLAGFGLTAAASVKLHETIKYNKSCDPLNDISNDQQNNEDEKKDKSNFRTNINSAHNKAATLNLTSPQKINENGIQTPLFPKNEQPDL